MIYIGIDPGLSGSVVATNPISGWIDLFDMPVRQKTKSGKNKKEIDGYKLKEQLKDMIGGCDNCINVELVGPRPGEGSVSGFSFGMGTGKIHGVLEAMGLTYNLVTPQVWKKAWRIPVGGDKKTTLKIARKLTMDNPLFKLEKHHNRSDGYCIAMYDAANKKVMDWHG